MNLSLFANKGFLPYIIKHLEKDGHKVLFNSLMPDTDICIVENIMFMYEIYRNLKMIKKNNIKLVNFINDIPVLQLQYDYFENYISPTFKQFLYHNANKNRFLYNYINNSKPNLNKGKLFNIKANIIEKYLKKRSRGRIYFQKQYRSFLKKADLNLSISKFTQKSVKKFLKIDTEVCHQCVNSDYLLSLPKTEIKYDAINISRLVKYKRQELFVEAANKLGLNILVIGNNPPRNPLKLNCPHLELPNNKDVFHILNQSKFYVDASIFEGFGMTPVEAAFLDKITIASDTFVHREILGDYPLYFKRDNVKDLIAKMKLVMEDSFPLKNSELKKKYSSNALYSRLKKELECII